MTPFSNLVSSFDNDAGKRGKQFEHFVKWFLQNDPEWSTQVDQVWLWEEYPDRWGVDCGIDLVFRHKNGEAWAVQAKCYSQQHDITKNDVDKFLSESNRKGIDKRLLIATTDRIGANAKQVCEAQEKSVFRYLLSNFESANIEYPASLSELRNAKRKPKPVPLEHQIEAIGNVVDNFQGVGRGQLIMACGTGKTFTTLWIKEKLQAKSTLILLPSLGLLSQTLHEWTLAANLPFEVLCVCSDQTVGKKGADEAIHSVADVAFPVTSNVEEICKFLHRDGAKVVFSTYQSSPLVAEAQSVSTVPAFDLAIADEAHRCAGKVDSSFSTILDTDRIRATKRMFTTATPRTYSTSVKKAADERGIEVVGMDDEAVFGKVLYALPFGEAIKRGLLTDYQVVIIGVDNPTIAAWIENRELLKTNTGIENDAESLAAQIGLLKAFKDYDLKRVISFHSRISRAEAFTKDLQQVIDWIGEEHKPSGTLRADFVSGAMPTDKRRKKLAKLKAIELGERGLLTNARCLSEGVDVPSLDCVAFIDPRGSQIDIIQAVGRAIRLSPNKKTGTIVLPVFIEDGDTPIESIEASNFKPIWDVLNALKAHDDVLSAEMDQLRTDMGRSVKSKVGAFSKVQVDLPASVDQSFGTALCTRLVEQVTASWEFWYGLLETFVVHEGHAKVPQKYTSPTGHLIGQWVSDQRKYRNTISEVRKARLETLPGWTWDLLGEQWDDVFQRLKKFANREGHSSPPHLYRTADGFRLGAWVGTQRRALRLMGAERIALLESLPRWSWDPFAEAWKNGFKYLELFADTEGHSRVAQSYRAADGYRLGSWVTEQRKAIAKLSPERKDQLESMPGWTWDPLVQKWDVNFKHLKEFAEREGHCAPSTEFVTKDGYQLRPWVARNRQIHDSLSRERRARLEALPGWTWVYEKGHAYPLMSERWLEGFRHLQEFVDREGHTRVPSRLEGANGFPLSYWVGAQRTKKDILSVDQVLRLEGLPGWSWITVQDEWETGIESLRKFVELKGHARPPYDYQTESGYLLGCWVSKKRGDANRLPIDKRRELEHLPGWTWDAFLDKWEEGFLHLREFAAREGHCSPAVKYKAEDGYLLGKWVSRHRGTKDSMSTERKARLEALPGWSWDALFDKWESGFLSLKEFAEREGHCLVPIRHVTKDGQRLGNWIAVQRRESLTLSTERKARLEALPGWTWDALSYKWEQGFQHLAEYSSLEGHVKVPNDYRAANGYLLGSWVSQQRKARYELPNERKELLESLPGWSWDVREDRWEEGFRCLKEFADRERHARIPKKETTPSGFRIGLWVSTQRQNADGLSSERKARLEALPGWIWRIK